MLGVLVDRIRQMQNPSKLFFFISDYHTGGAEQVHVDILRLFAKERPWVISVLKSKNGFHKASMQQCAELYEIGKHVNNQNRFFVKNFFFGYYISLINRHRGAVVIGSLNNFIPDICPHLKNAYLMDIIHCFCGIKPVDMIRPTGKLDKRILVSKHLQDELHLLYDEWGVDTKYKQRTQVIYNAVNVPDSLPAKDYKTKLKVAFIGRNSHEKRYHLYERIAHTCIEQGLNMQFHSIGNFHSTADINCLGELSNREAIYDVLNGFHILILCSTTEGFGLVIAEAMARGMVAIATAVGGVTELIVDAETGNLVHSTEEGSIEDEFVRHLKRYSESPQLLQQMGAAAYARVKQEFNYEVFGGKYLALIDEARRDIASRTEASSR